MEGGREVGESVVVGVGKRRVKVEYFTEFLKRKLPVKFQKEVLGGWEKGKSDRLWVIIWVQVGKRFEDKLIEEMEAFDRDTK
jgi:hypothetical protein